MRMFFGHDEPADGEGSRFVAMQRAASAAGLAYLDAGSHLCLHPRFGPWFALRATLVFDAVEYTGARCVASCMHALRKLQAFPRVGEMKSAVPWKMTCELPVSGEQNLPQPRNPCPQHRVQWQVAMAYPLLVPLQHRQLWRL